MKRMQDIDRALNEIIIKYQLDSYYPHFRNKYEAEKVLRNMIAEAVQHQKNILFIGDDQTGIDFVRNIARMCEGVHFCTYNRNDASLRELDGIDWNVYDCVYLISFMALDILSDGLKYII